VLITFVCEIVHRWASQLQLIRCEMKRMRVLPQDAFFL